MTLRFAEKWNFPRLCVFTFESSIRDDLIASAMTQARERVRSKGGNMRKIYIAATLVALAGFSANATAQERTITGAAIGAGAGAAVAGPPGAVVGGVAGAVIGGPRLSRRAYHRRSCWLDRRGFRHCR
jgi:hypothetical protein